MKITYIGHSCFLLESSGGVRILLDPYQHGAYNGSVKYRPVSEEADAVLVSHTHPDHNYVEGIPGKPTVIGKTGEHEVKGLRIRGVPAFHDQVQGAQRGPMILFRVEMDGIVLVHLGDLGHVPDKAAAGNLAPVDVLFLPVGGQPFTVALEAAEETRRLLSPRLTIPMHYKTRGVDFPILHVDDFLRGKKAEKRSSSVLEATRLTLPEGILVLRPSALP